jgi:hypothetical protein
MKRIAIVPVLIVLSVIGSVYADYAVSEHGAWPKSWPKELDPLRKTSRTLVGPRVETSHYEIPFTRREDFEAAWPFILKVKSVGAPIILKRGPKTDFFAVKPAGVLIHSPPAGGEQPIDPKIPVTQSTFNQHIMSMTYIELIVDGNIVDLNRIQLPPDTFIMDERFTEPQKK